MDAIDHCTICRAIILICRIPFTAADIALVAADNCTTNAILLGGSLTIRRLNWLIGILEFRLYFGVNFTVMAIVEFLVITEIDTIDPGLYHSQTKSLDVFVMSRASCASKCLDLIVEPFVDTILDDDFDSWEVDTLITVLVDTEIIRSAHLQ